MNELFFRKCIVGLLVTSLFSLFISCATTKNYNPKLYGDVIGFNDKVIIDNENTGKFTLYNLQTTDGKTKIHNAILTLPSGDNTAAYYALDIALDRISEVQKKYMEGDPASRYYIVFFTDGLDNVSTQLARNNRRGDYINADAYGRVLQNRMSQILDKKSLSGNRQNKTNTFQSYVILYKGEDILKSGYTDEELVAKLDPLIGAQNEERPKLILGDNFDKLLIDFQNTFMVTSFSFVLPKGYAGSRVRMELNGAENKPEDQKIYIEADFKKHNKTEYLFFNTEYYTLENIETSKGLRFQIPPDGVIEMDKERYNKKDILVPFFITGLRMNELPYSIKRELVYQWFYEDGKIRWNSEYKSEENTGENAYILLVMDTSKSFEDKINVAKETAIKIISYIGEND